jgi:hypothetical protein
MNEESNFKFVHPSSILLVGPSSSGKSILCYNLIKNIDKIFDKKIVEIIWCYSESQPLHEKITKISPLPIRFLPGLPDIDEITQGDTNYEPKLLVLDDLMTQKSGNQIVDLFIKHSHHKNLSVIFILQNLFHQSKGMRDISINAHYLILMKNPREKAQINYFARQFLPENSKFVNEAYLDATSEPYSYILFDLKQETPDHLRIRSKIFPQDTGVVYVPKHLLPKVKQLMSEVYK